MRKLSAMFPPVAIPKAKAVPMDFGTVLSISNNQFHPVLTRQGVEAFAMAHDYLTRALPHLQQVGSKLKNYEIRTNEFFTALGLLNSYIYILESTLEKPENELLAAYVKSQIGGEK